MFRFLLKTSELRSGLVVRSIKLFGFTIIRIRSGRCRVIKLDTFTIFEIQYITNIIKLAFYSITAQAHQMLYLARKEHPLNLVPGIKS